MLDSTPDFYTKCLFADLAQRFVYASSEHFSALFDTLSTLIHWKSAFVHAYVGIHNQTATAHAGRRNTASCGKVGDKWWISGGKMLSSEHAAQPHETVNKLKGIL
jgi:hypothetical protein